MKYLILIILLTGCDDGSDCPQSEQEITSYRTIETEYYTITNPVWECKK